MKKLFKYLFFLAFCISLSIAAAELVAVTFSQVQNFIDRRFNYHPAAFFSIMFAYMIALIAVTVVPAELVRRKLNILKEE